ncbi:hypothetical protein Dsin_028516 [Dipteronia sinensis]|uniref:Uncharacterized protein n=1 Tax=Dipteronia sinensis TaxID=43782 RepID=A0AAD9ZQQ0_9ROSI|nr:hypothetical protein Dsin_028516 [Dipteronia sinensis]
MGSCLLLVLSGILLINDKFKQQLGHKESSTSGTRSSGSETKLGGGNDSNLQDTVLSSGMQTVLSMRFSYLQVTGIQQLFCFV